MRIVWRFVLFVLELIFVISVGYSWVFFFFFFMKVGVILSVWRVFM